MYEAIQGDIILISLDPQTGHEQKGKRPALVVSNNTFNSFARGSAMVCPITNTNNGIPTQVNFDSRTKTTGVIMCEQAKVLDLNARNVKFLEKIPDAILFEVIDIIKSIIEIE